MTSKIAVFGKTSGCPEIPRSERKKKTPGYLLSSPCDDGDVNGDDRA